MNIEQKENINRNTGSKVHIDSKEVERLAAQGLTNPQICDSLGISEATLYRQKRKSTELTDAIKRGRARGVANVTNKLYEQCMEGNTTAILFYLKARAHWRDRDPVEFNTTDAPVTINFKRGSDVDD